jgi:hypothetical protein
METNREAVLLFKRMDGSDFFLKSKFVAKKEDEVFSIFLVSYSQLRKTAVDIDLSNIVNCAVLRSTIEKTNLELNHNQKPVSV